MPWRKDFERIAEMAFSYVPHRTEARAPADVNVIPNGRTGADAHVLLDDGGGMDLVAHEPAPAYDAAPTGRRPLWPIVQIGSQRNCRMAA